MKEYLNVFNLIAQMKDVNKVSYEIDKADMNILLNYWYLYKFNRYLSFKKFRKVVVDYSVFTGQTLHIACEALCKKTKF